MFCGKCGHQNRDGAKFCDNCGTRLGQALQRKEQQSASNQQYDPNQPNNPNQQYNPNQQRDPNQLNNPNQQYDPNGQDPEKQADGKKDPKSSNNKKFILISVICAAVIIALTVVLFAVIIPGLSKSDQGSSLVDMTRYLTVKVNDISDDGKAQTVYDGKISGLFTFDSERLSRDTGLQPARAASLFTRIQRFVTIDYNVIGKTTNTPKFANVSSEDVAIVSYKWPDESSTDNTSQRSGMDSIMRIESEYGVSFKHENTTCEYKMSDLLNAKGITVKKSVEFDMMNYIKENNLIFTEGTRSGQLKVGIKPFDAVFDGIKYSLKKDSFNVTVSSGDNNMGSVELKFDKKINLKNNQVVTLNYDQSQRQRLENVGVILTGNPVKYTVKAPETSTAATTAPATTVPVVTTVPKTTAPTTTVPPTTTTPPPTTAPPATPPVVTTAPPTTVPQTSVEPETTVPETAESKPEE